MTHYDGHRDGKFPGWFQRFEEESDSRQTFEHSAKGKPDFMWKSKSSNELLA